MALSKQTGIQTEMKTKFHMEGIVNGHSFEVEGNGSGQPYEGVQKMKLTVTKGAPLPFSIDILLPQEMYGSKPFIKYPDNIPDYIKLSFPEGITWERTMTFEDGAVCTASNDSRLVGNCFIYEVKFQGVNFPRDGPVMQRKTKGWEPSTERLYEWDGCQRGDVDMALKLEDGGHYTVNFKTTYKSKKKDLKVPPYHFVDHKLELLSHNIVGTKEDFEQKETAHAHLSSLDSLNQ